MINIQYFASIRETLDRDQEELELPASVTTVEQLIAHLLQLNPHFGSVFDSSRKVLVAVNQTVVDHNFNLTGDEEVAFFPPMTGG
ncbi:MAG: molybdopterin converting factor subunit 1 [SAR86 cluster bacterium]|uniref:Molybdopterin synthase sulfur carrier subunit n=1 Tax=SAR86 cluster bacterium TaxID=2030880 RepID=A0A2A5B4W5_9GAMM|nr:MAG: molybdopterin converting factor subunit 1 [SAR86 cluster bacterium]